MAAAQNEVHRGIFYNHSVFSKWVANQSGKKPAAMRSFLSVAENWLSKASIVPFHNKHIILACACLQYLHKYHKYDQLSSSIPLCPSFFWWNKHPDARSLILIWPWYSWKLDKRTKIVSFPVQPYTKQALLLPAASELFRSTITPQLGYKNHDQGSDFSSPLPPTEDYGPIRDYWGWRQGEDGLCGSFGRLSCKKFV